VCGKNWEYTEEERSDLGDLGWWDRYEKRKLPDDRLPFSLNNLNDILETSFKEVFGASMIIRISLVAVGFWLMLTWAGWGVVWRAAMILCIFLGSLIYRYYYSSESDLKVSLLSSAALAFLFTVITRPTFSITFGRRYAAFREPVYRIIQYGGANVFAILFLLTFVLLYILWVRPFNWVKLLES